MTTVTAETLDAALDVLTAAEYRVDVRTDHSGRGMFGKTCLGVVLAHRAVPLLAVALAKVAPDAAEVLVRAQEQGEMGLDAIVYWPGVSLVGVSMYAEGDEDL